MAYDRINMRDELRKNAEVRAVTYFKGLSYNLFRRNRSSPATRHGGDWGERRYSFIHDLGTRWG
jgi:hypothetical protein